MLAPHSLRDPVPFAAVPYRCRGAHAGRCSCSPWSAAARWLRCGGWRRTAATWTGHAWGGRRRWALPRVRRTHASWTGCGRSGGGRGPCGAGWWGRRGGGWTRCGGGWWRGRREGVGGGRLGGNRRTRGMARESSEGAMWAWRCSGCGAGRRQNEPDMGTGKRDSEIGCGKAERAGARCEVGGKDRCRRCCVAGIPYLAERKSWLCRHLRHK